MVGIGEVSAPQALEAMHIPAARAGVGTVGPALIAECDKRSHGGRTASFGARANRQCPSRETASLTPLGDARAGQALLDLPCALWEVA